MAFPPHFLDDIRARVPLADVIQRRMKLQKRGREFVGLCPFHSEKTPSFTVNEDKGFFHCFGCGEHGDVIGFVMKTDGLSFPEAVERLAGEAGLAMPARTPDDIRREKKAKGLYELMEAACVFFEQQLRADGGKEAADYLTGRSFDNRTVVRYRLGWAPDKRDALKIALMGQDFSEDMLLEGGLLSKPEDGRPTYDKFRGRVIFPIADRRGRIIAFGGRVLGDGMPKYLNSPDTPVFHKGHVLYAMDKAAEATRPRAGEETAPVVVTEGYTDVIALHRAGFGGAVAPLGTALTENQIELLWRLADEPILCFDGDLAGERAAARAAERALPLLKPGKSVRFALLPAGEDPDTLIRNQGQDAMARVLKAAFPLVEMIWRMETANRSSDTPERKAQIRAALRTRGFEVADKTVQQYYLAEFDKRCQEAFTPQRAQQGGWRGGPGQGQGFGRGKFGGGRFGGPPRRGGFTAGRWQSGPNGGPNGGQWVEDTGVRTDGNTDVMLLRQQQVLVAALITHPALLDEVAEEFGTVSLPSRDLDGLRQEMLASVGLIEPKDGESEVDTEALKNHLHRKGFGPAVDRLLGRELYELWPFVRAGSDIEDARQGWRQIFDRFRQRDAGSGIDDAVRALAEAPSERNKAYLERLREERERLNEPDNLD